MSSYRLEAINRCLDAIGESPVNSPQSGVPDAETASRLIDQVTREILQAGWTPNSAFNVKMTPDLGQVIKVPDNLLRIDTTGSSRGIAVTSVRDSDGIDKLFQIKDQSFVFTAPVWCDLVYYFDIDALPFALQNYIAASAARKFQRSVLGSVSLDGFTSQEVDEAWTILLDYEADQEDSNCLTDSAYMRAITGRNNPLSGR